MTTHGLRRLSLEGLEHRRCLTSSFGWDGPGTGSAELLYSIGPIPEELDRQQVESTVEAALNVWSNAADIRFQQTARSGQADAIDFHFTAIDGPGGTLARAYFPDDLNRNPIAGDVQFDVDENWENGNEQGSSAFDLMLVAVHEIGHALGLNHSPGDSDVMHHAVSSQDRFQGLSENDVDQVLALYAAVATPPIVSLSPALPASTADNRIATNRITTGSPPLSNPKINIVAPPAAIPPKTAEPREPVNTSSTPQTTDDADARSRHDSAGPEPTLTAIESPWALLRYRLTWMRTAFQRVAFNAAATSSVEGGPHADGDNWIDRC